MDLVCCSDDIMALEHALEDSPFEEFMERLEDSMVSPSAATTSATINATTRDEVDFLHQPYPLVRTSKSQSTTPSASHDDGALETPVKTATAEDDRQDEQAAVTPSIPSKDRHDDDDNNDDDDDDLNEHSHGHFLEHPGDTSGRGPLSPFSPLLKNDSIVSLSTCRIVSVIVRIDPVDHQQHNNNICLFPMLLKSSSHAHAHGTSPTPSPSNKDFWNDPKAFSKHDLIVVNPTAFGTNIPSEITLERARLVSQVARQESEDWIRMFRFPQILWSTHEQQQWVPMAQAMAMDVTQPGSISHRTVVAAGNPSTQQNVGKSVALFGNVILESVAHVMSSQFEITTDVDVVQRYGILGLTAQKILAMAPQKLVTMAILEIAEDELHDLQKSKPFAQDGQLRLRYAESSTPGDARVASVTGLSDIPVESLKGMGRSLRRAWSMATHPKRTKPRGSILVTLKVWHGSATDKSIRKYTVVQFLDMHSVEESLVENAGQGRKEALARRNASVRKSTTALAVILRRLLLKEAGNGTSLSYRECTLTKVLQRSLDHPDARVVVLANLSPRTSDYESSISTLRFVNGIMSRPGQPMANPFDELDLSPTAHSSSDATSQLSFGQFSERESLMRNLVGDPRQRIAKLLKPSASKSHEKAAIAGEISYDPYTPTSYMEIDPGDYADSIDRRAEERGRDLLDTSTVNEEDYDGLPTPLIRNGSSVPPPSKPLHRVGRNFTETTFSLDTMERGGDDYGYDEPSPLTTDTGGLTHSFGSFDADNDAVPMGKLHDYRSPPHEAAQQFLGSSLPGYPVLIQRDAVPPPDVDDGLLKPSFSQQMDELSLELYEKTSGLRVNGNPAHDTEIPRYSASDVAEFQIELESLRHDLKGRDDQVLVLTESQARFASGEVNRELEQVREDLRLREEEIEALLQTLDEYEKSVGTTEKAKRLQIEQNSVEELYSLVVQRDEMIRDLQNSLATAESRNADRSTQESENQVLQQGLAAQLEAKDAMIAELREAMVLVKGDHHHSLESAIADLAAQRSTCSEYQMGLDRSRNEIVKYEQQNRHLHDELDNMRAMYESQAKDMESLTAVRGSVEVASRPSNQELESRLAEFRREVQLRELNIKELEDALEQTRRQMEQSQAEHVAAVMAERNRWRKDSQEMKFLLSREVDGHRTAVQELENDLRSKDSEVSRLQVEVHRLKSGVDTRDAQEHQRLEQLTEDLRRQLEHDRNRSRRSLDLRDSEIKVLKEALESTRIQWDHFREEETREIAADRDRIRAELTSANELLREQLRKYKSELDLHRLGEKDQVNDLRRQLDSFQQVRGEELAVLSAERDKAELSSRLSVNELEREQEKHKRDIERRDEHIRHLEESVVRARQSDQQSRDHEVAALKDERNQIEQELRSLRDSFELQMEKHCVEMAEKNEEVRKISGVLETTSREKQILQAQELSEIKALQASEKDLRHTLTVLRAELDSSRRQHTTIADRLTRTEEESWELRNQLQMSTTAFDQEHSTNSELSKQIRQLQLEIDSLRNVVADRDAGAADLHRRLGLSEEEFDRVQRQARDDLEEIRSKLADAQEDSSSHRSEIDKRDQQIHGLESKIRKLETERAEVMKIAEEAIATQAELERKNEELLTKLSQQAIRSTSLDLFREVEKTQVALAEELSESRSELFQSRSELNETKKRLSEIQFSLRNTEKERDLLLAREAEHKREAERMAGQLQDSLKSIQGLAQLRQEKILLEDELETLDERYQTRISDLTKHAAERDEVCHRYQEELDSARAELSASLEERNAEALAFENEIARIQGRLVEVEALAERHGSMADELEVERSMKSSLVEELDQTRCDLSDRISDVKRLSLTLKEVLQEKDSAVEKAESLKKALATFQDETRSRVQRYVHDRSETKVALARSVEENEALVSKNHELRSLIDELQRTRLDTDRGDTKHLRSQINTLSTENLQLRGMVEDLREQLLSRRAERGPLERPGTSSWRSPASRRGDTDDLLAWGMSERLSAEYDVGKSSRWDVPESVYPVTAEIDIVAHLAKSAKESMERTITERDVLRNQLLGQRGQPRSVSVASLGERIANLETMVSSDRSHRLVNMSEADEIVALSRRVSDLERRIEEERLLSGTGGGDLVGRRRF